MKIDLSTIGLFTVIKNYKFVMVLDDNDNEIYLNNYIGGETWTTYNRNHNKVYYRTSTGFEVWTDFNAAGYRIHYKNSDGCESWYNPDGDEVTAEQFKKIYGVLL